MKAIGYVRVSTEEQAKEGVSLDNQRRKIELYSDINDMNLISIISDEGISAKDLNRPGIQNLLKMVSNREVDAVIIYKLDRMFRDTIDALKTSRLFEKKGIALHSINEKLDTHSAVGKFYFTLIASLAEMERNIISERTSDAMQAMRLRREHTGNVAYGFNLCSDGKHVEPDPIEQSTLCFMGELRDKGLSYRAIAAQLNEMGYTTRKGTKWQHNYVHRMLKSREPP